MKQRMGLALIAAILVAMMALVMVMAQPSLAAPGAQGSILPTPTWVPFDEEARAYTVEQVGGEDKTLTFQHEAVDGFTLGESTVRSLLPNGMFYTLDIQDSEAEIERVLLVLSFIDGSASRGEAHYNPESGLWEVHLWPVSSGRPPAWAQFAFSWRIRDVNGNQIETEPIPIEYWDPARHWWKVDNAYTLVFWRGFSDEDPDYFASVITDKLAASHNLKLAGLGWDIPDDTVHTIYGSREEWAEASGVTNPSAGGSTSGAFSMTEMYVPAYTSDKTVRATAWLSGAVTHELMHLVQNRYFAGRGPDWFIEGQADYFSFGDGDQGYLVDDRLRNLAQMQELPYLSGNVPRDIEMADGLLYYNYNAGQSFINWLVNTYGIEAHRAIIDAMRDGAGFYEAFEVVFDRPFVTFENEWRAYLGETPVDMTKLDPTLALEPYEDPVLAVGDMVKLPAIPPVGNVFDHPGPNVKIAGPCFGGTEVEILRMGTLDGVPYFEVNCQGITGWMSRDQVIES